MAENGDDILASATQASRAPVRRRLSAGSMFVTSSWCCRARWRRRARLDRQHRLDVGDRRQQAAAAGLLLRLEGRRASPDEVARGRVGRTRAST